MSHGSQGASAVEAEPFTKSLERMNSFQEPEARGLIADLGLPAGSRGLDVGCGVGLYALTYILTPSAFSVNPAIAVQLEDWQLKRSLFDYLSFTTLTSLGYGDITPVGQPAYSLTWLEVLFGQFYMAVVVAQMVGLKLAQAIKGSGQGSR